MTVGDDTVLGSEAPSVEGLPLRPADSARSRVEVLADDGTFLELGSQRLHRATGFGLEDKRVPGDGVVAGTAAIDGRPVHVFAQDRYVLSGSLGEAHADRIADTIAKATRGGTPVIGINDSGGARIQEGVASLDGYGRVFSANVAASGRVPQISVILGACAGGAVYLAGAHGPHHHERCRHDVPDRTAHRARRDRRRRRRPLARWP